MLDSYDLFCFDFDGLLVDTESIHHFAYLEMLKREGAHLELDFHDYCALAHSPNRNKLPNFCYERFPHLNSDWTSLRKKKIAIYTEILRSKAPALMPGVEEFITRLIAEKKDLCVVTNSHKEDTDIIKAHHPILSKIETWITRDDVREPKPNPEPYLKALTYFQCPSNKAIGFEDTLRGIESLIAANIHPVLLAKPDYPGAAEAKDLTVFETFSHIAL